MDSQQEWFRMINEGRTMDAQQPAAMNMPGAYGLGGQSARPLAGQANAFQGTPEQRMAMMANARAAMPSYNQPQASYAAPQAAQPSRAQPAAPAPAEFNNLMSFLGLGAQPQPAPQPSMQQQPAMQQQPSMQHAQAMAQQSYGGNTMPQSSYAAPISAAPQRMPAADQYAAMQAQAQHQALARMNEHRRMQSGNKPAVTSLLPQLQPQPSTSSAPPAESQARPLNASDSPIAAYVKEMNRLNGLKGRMAQVAKALQEGVTVPLGNQPGGQPLDAQNVALYQNQLLIDRQAAAQLQQKLQAYVQANGGDAAVLQQYQASLEQQKRLAQQQGVASAMQPVKAGQVPQQQPASLPAHAVAAPPRQPASAVPSTTSVAPQRSSPPLNEQISSAFKHMGLPPAAFEASMHELRSSGRLPPLHHPLVINGKEVKLYELVRAVLSIGGSEYISIKKAWHQVALVTNLLTSIEADPMKANRIGYELSDIYYQHVKVFEDQWVAAVFNRQRQLSGDNAQAQSLHQQMPMMQPSSQQQAQMMQQQQMAARSAAQPGRSTPVAQPPSGKQQPSAPVAASAASQALPKLTRLPTEAELQSAKAQVEQLDQLARTEMSRPSTALVGLHEQQQADIRALCAETLPLARNLRQQLPLYVCIVGAAPSRITVHRWLSTIYRVLDQAQKLNQGIFYVTAEQLKSVRDGFSSALRQISLALKDVPKPDRPPVGVAAEPLVGAADRETVMSGIKPGLRREDLKPPPTKRMRSTVTIGDSPAAEVASPGKSAATPEGTSPRPVAASAPSRGRQNSARGAPRGRARDPSVGHSRTSSVGTAVGRSPAVQAAPLPIDPAEQRRIEMEQAKANPAQHAIDAFLRYQSVQASRSFSATGLAEDLGSNDARDSFFSIAPVAANPPPAPTLSSLAPGWPPADALPVARTEATVKEDDGGFDYSDFLNLEEEPTTPDLHSSNDSPPDDAVVTPKSVSGAGKRKRDEGSSPAPIVPELGEQWSWDYTFSGNNEPVWQALVF